MLASSAARILRDVPDDAVVLDVGGGAFPFPRADWVVDLLPYDERGRYGELHPEQERFTRDTWVVHDICGRDPLPFDDKSIDFVVCSHTLEDVRDPIRVCDELERVGRAGYIETPSRLEEQAAGVNGPWVGWSHHRWLVEAHGDRLDFVFKHHVVCGRPSAQFPHDFWKALTPEERVVAFWWTGTFAYRERLFDRAEELDAWLEEPVRRRLGERRPPPGGFLSRIGRRLAANR